MTSTLTATRQFQPPQLSPHVATTAAGTWEAAPAQALVNGMATVVMTTTPTAITQPGHQPQLQPSPVETLCMVLVPSPARITLTTTRTTPTVSGSSGLHTTKESSWHSRTCNWKTAATVIISQSTMGRLLAHDIWGKCATAV